MLEKMSDFFEARLDGYDEQSLRVMLIASLNTAKENIQ